MMHYIATPSHEWLRIDGEYTTLCGRIKRTADRHPFFLGTSFGRYSDKAQATVTAQMCAGCVIREHQRNNNWYYELLVDFGGAEND